MLVSKGSLANLLVEFQPQLNLFFCKLVGGFNPSEKKCAFRKNGGCIFPNFRGEDSQKNMWVASTYSISLWILTFHCWLKVSSSLCCTSFRPGTARSAALRFGDRSIINYRSLCESLHFFLHLVFHKEHAQVKHPNSKVVFKKKCWQGRFGMKKGQLLRHSVGVPKTSNKTQIKTGGHYITNPKQCISYQENPWKLPVPSTFIPPTQVAVHLVKLQYFTNLGFPGQ